MLYSTNTSTFLLLLLYSSPKFIIIIGMKNGPEQLVFIFYFLKKNPENGGDLDEEGTMHTATSGLTNLKKR